MKKLLFIEDEEKLIKYLEMFFKMKGYQVCVAQLGRAGIELFKDENPHVVFIDIGLPDIDGDKVLEEIRKIDQKVPIAVLTGHTDEDLKKKVFSLGANAFFGKPCMYADLVEWIEKVS